MGVEEPRLTSDPEAAIVARLKSVSDRVGFVDLGDDTTDPGILEVVAKSAEELGFGEGASLLENRGTSG